MPFVQFVSGPGKQQLLEPARQTPPEQVSLLVQALPSSQGALLGVKVHPVPLQASSVHTLPSSQVNAVPEQTPLAHVSLRVQRLLSLQGALLGGKLHPPAP